MTRVLEVHHFCYPAIAGGVDRVVKELVDTLGAQDCILFEVGNWEDRRLEQRIESGIRVYRRRLRMPGSGRDLVRRMVCCVEVFTTFLQLIGMVRRHGIRLVHLHTLQDYHWYFQVLKRLTGVDIVVTLHGSETLAYPDRPRSQKQLWAKVLGSASAITAVSRELSRNAHKLLPIEAPPEVICNGISDPRPQAFADGRHPIPASGYAVCVGALRPCKGHDIAIAAWSLLAADGVQLDLVIAGEGEWRDWLTTEAQRLGCADRVHLPGAMDHSDVLRLVSTTTLFLMPSRNEGLPMALLEAAALEKPIVASDIPAFSEVITHGVNGLLFAPEDATALARQVSRILADESGAERLACAARERYLSAYSSKTMVERYVQLFTSIMPPCIPEPDVFLKKYRHPNDR